MKKLVLTLTALASLTIAAQAQSKSNPAYQLLYEAQLEPKPSYGGWWSYRTFGFTDLSIEYEWVGQEGDFVYEGAISQWGKGYVAWSLPGARIQNSLYFSRLMPPNGIYKHINTNLLPVPVDR